jgi:hypothetical protein
MLSKARAAMQEIEGYDQERVDRLCRAVAWATANDVTATRLANMSVDESGWAEGLQPGARKCWAFCAMRCDRKVWA